MASETKAVQLVQAAIGNRDPKFRSHIKTAIEIAWAHMAALAEWWFLEKAAPHALSITADEDEYTINRTDVGLMLHIANDSGRKIWTYKSRRSYQLYLARPTITNPTESVDSATSTNVAVFTVRGLKRGKPFIQVRPIPSVSQTVYLHYQEKGTLGNLGNLPDAWMKVLFHNTMSMLAEPQELNKARWLAMTGEHGRQFEDALADMIRMECPSIDETREFEVDPHIAAQIEEVNLL